MAETKKSELVFIPSPGLGHLVSVVEVSKLLISHNNHLSITIMIMARPNDTNIHTFKKSLKKSSDSRIRYLDLRPEPTDSPVSFHQFVPTHKAHVREIFTEMSKSTTSKLVGMIVDMFCITMFDVANEFSVPAYIFYASGAAMLGFITHLQCLRDERNEDVADYRNSKTEVSIPAYINPVPTKVFPSLLFDKTGGSKMFLDQAKRYREAKGILVNTFRELETHAIDALSKEKNLPQVYPIGPMLSLKKDAEDDQIGIMKWLDLQPVSSVVFLCFGSEGAFDAPQVMQIACALEQSGHRFIWSLRKPVSPGQMGFPGDYENVEEVLPEGFLARTSGTGKVIGWAPQAAILAHVSVGGFVSHCGWNSVLESVWYGVPLAAWPLYAEQQVNAFLLVKDLELAVEIKMDYKKHSTKAFLEFNSEDVGAEVIEKAIRALMEPENEVRKKVKDMQGKIRVVLNEGGSSHSSMRCFIEDALSNVE